MDILLIREFCNTKNTKLLDKLSPISLSLLIKYSFISHLKNIPLPAKGKNIPLPARGKNKKLVSDIYNKYSSIYNINRFLNSQNNGNIGSTYDQVIKELKFGKKKSHWIWYIFPQLNNLISNPSDINKLFSISGLNEVFIYLMNNTLRTRLITCHNLVFENIMKGKTIKDIFGSDDKKYISHLTLFYYIIEDKELHSLLDMIKKYANITLDNNTIKLINTN